MEIKVNVLNAVSVLDGRYAGLLEDLRDIFSEYGLIKHRVFIEIEWLKFILNDLELSPLSENETESVSSIYSGFNRESASLVKQIEKTTNHDVKAVEYYIKQELEKRGLNRIKEWVHFCCTSEDINNTSYALMIRSGKNIACELSIELLRKIEDLAMMYKSIPMMSRTHGQPATPTTVGKEFINYAARIKRESLKLQELEVEGKMNGATGNYSAHSFVKPDINWAEQTEIFIREKLSIKQLPWTTQINNYHYISEFYHTLIRLSSTVIDFDRDLWSYISINYFKQKTKKGEVGSSTMPHKVNPIDFENSEGNLGIGISMMEHLSVKLLNSRFQRDLTDSTVLRNSGAILGYFIIGLKNCIKGISKLDLNEAVIIKDLENNPELLAEPIQTAMRMFGEENPYEKLKELTRGQKINMKTLKDFINSLEKVPAEEKMRMIQLTPSNYLGLAEQLVDLYFSGK
jgi:adenylosuccinate lyase